MVAILAKSIMEPSIPMRGFASYRLAAHKIRSVSSADSGGADGLCLCKRALKDSVNFFAAGRLPSEIAFRPQLRSAARANASGLGAA
jgi:hypothetical protein